MINYSVIIPHFSKNGTAFLERSVYSIPERDDIEVLVVDNSLSPIDPHLFKGRINTFILYSDNKYGAGGARNLGLKNARGKWLLFLDSDDFFLNTAFTVFDKYLNSSYDVIYFKLTSIFSATGEIADRHYSYCKMVDDFLFSINDESLRVRHCVPWSKMIRKSFVIENQIIFDEVPASNDMFFALNVGLKAKSICADNSEVYCLTVTKGSITNTDSLKNVESVFFVRIRVNSLLKKYGYKPAYSVVYLIYRASKFGLFPCLRLFCKALISGNLFVGYQNWLKTLRKGVQRYPNYIVKE